MKTIKLFLLFLFVISFALVLIINCEKKPTVPEQDNPVDGNNIITSGDPFQLSAVIANGGVKLCWSGINIESVQGYNIYRSEHETTGYTRIQQTASITTYTDRTIENGHSYWYKVTAYVTGGEESSQTNVAAVRINSEPVIIINGNDQYTATRSVNLTILATTATHIWLSSNDQFSEGDWESYKTTKTWTLNTGEGSKTVYLKAKYSDDTISNISSDSIEPQPMEPTILIANDSTYSATRNVVLNLSATGENLQVKVSEDSSFSDVSWTAYTETKNFILSTGERTKTVYAKFKNDFEIESEFINDMIDPLPMSPTIIIAEGAQYTTTRQVMVNLTAKGTNLKMKLSEDSNFSGHSWQDYKETMPFTLSTGNDTKTVFAQFKNDFEIESQVINDEIEPQLVTDCSIVINTGADTTNSNLVTLTVQANNATLMMLSNSPDFNGAEWETYTNTKAWDLSAGAESLTTNSTNKPEGDTESEITNRQGGASSIFEAAAAEKEVFAKFKNEFEVETSPVSDKIIVAIRSQILINDGEQYTPSRNVVLNLTSENADEMIIDNDSTFTVSQWEQFSNTKNWALPLGKRRKYVYVKFRNNSGAVSKVYSDSIEPLPMEPLILIENGEQYTATRDVSVELSAEGINIKVQVSEDSTFSGVSWENFVASKNITLSVGDGTKIVYAKFMNDFEIETNAIQDDLILDTTPPSPSFIVSPETGVTLETNFNFDASATSDNISNPIEIQIRWDWENDASYDTDWSIHKTPTHQYSLGGGNKIVTLDVKDGVGNTITISQQIYVNTRPVASFTATQDSNDNKTFNFNASTCSDFEDGTNLEYRWDWENDGSWDTNYGANKTATHRYTNGGDKTINLEVRDKDGLAHSSTNQISVPLTITDVDGNIYEGIKIGNQWWMTENLRVTRYSNGDSIPNLINSEDWHNKAGYCIYDNIAVNATIYGCIYNGRVLDDSRNIAPAGWHIPSDAEWKTLEIYLGMSQLDANSTEYRGTNEGGKLKETEFEHWNSPNTGATNESGFRALPGGRRNAGGPYEHMGVGAYFWSSTRIYATAWYRSLSNTKSEINRNYYGIAHGFSVRCVKD